MRQGRSGRGGPFCCRLLVAGSLQVLLRTHNSELTTQNSELVAGCRLPVAGEHSSFSTRATCHPERSEGSPSQERRAHMRRGSLTPLRSVRDDNPCAIRNPQSAIRNPQSPIRDRIVNHLTVRVLHFQLSSKGAAIWQSTDGRHRKKSKRRCMSGSGASFAAAAGRK